MPCTEYEAEQFNKYTPKPIDIESVIPFKTPMELYQALKNLYKDEELVELEIDKDHVITRTLKNLEN